MQIFGYVYHDTHGQIHGPVWKTQWFLLNDICMVIPWQDCYGKGNLRKSYWNTVGRRFPVVNAYSYTVKKDYSYLCIWMTSNWFESNKMLIRCGKYWRRSWFGRTNIIRWPRIFGMCSKTVWNKKWYCWQLHSHVCFANFRGRNRKIPCSENLRISSWSYDMEGHAKKCVERYCELANKTTQQLYKVSTSLHRWPPLQRRRNKIRGRFVKSMLSNCSQMLILGTDWKT